MPYCVQRTPFHSNQSFKAINSNRKGDPRQRVSWGVLSVDLGFPELEEFPHQRNIRYDKDDPEDHQYRGLAGFREKNAHDDAYGEQAELHRSHCLPSGFFAVPISDLKQFHTDNSLHSRQSIRFADDLQVLKDQCRLNTVATAKALAATVGCRACMEPVSLRNMRVDDIFQFTQITGASSPELFFQRNLKHNVGQIASGSSRER